MVTPTSATTLEAQGTTGSVTVTAADTATISASLPACSVVRPTKTAGAATGALNFLTAMGLFIGQSDAFFSYMTGLAQAADAAQRGI